MADLNTKLSKNFSLGEFLYSATAERHNDIVAVQYAPSEEIIENLQYLCKKVLQPVRDKLGVPMKITSGYRCKLLNDLVGSSDSSQHLVGQAADVQMSETLLSDQRYREIKNKIKRRVKSLTGQVLRDDVNANFYLFSYICIRMEFLDIDQVIHEYGEARGRPGWIHVAAAADARDKREIVAFGRYLEGGKDKPDLIKALKYGTELTALS